MQYSSVTNLRYADAGNTHINCLVKFAGFDQAVPFTASPDDPEAHGRDIFARALKGEFGAISSYVAPPAPPTPVPRQISDRQFFQQLALDGIITEDEALAAIGPGVIPPVLDGIIAGLPSAEQFGARCLLMGATVFERSHPMVAMVATARNMSAADVDAFFARASSLG